MSTPKVSVIIPAFNSGKSITAALESLIRQTLTNIEIIVVDDGSSDNTIELVTNIAAEDQRIKLISLSTNKGAHEARAEGLKYASGDWIGFMDADDLVQNSMFEQMWRNGEASQASIVICGINLIKDSGEIITSKLRFNDYNVIHENIFPRFCQRQFGTGSLWNKLYHRDIIIKNGTRSFAWRQDFNEDVLVNIGCFMDAKSIKIIPKNLYGYVINPNSTTQAIGNPLSYVQIFRAYALAINHYKHYGEECLSWIDYLYRKQISYSCYWIREPSELLPYLKELQEAIKIINTFRPISIALQANQGPWATEVKPESLLGHYQNWVDASKKLAVYFVVKLIKKGINK